MNFRDLLSYEDRERLDAVEREINRLYHLSDRWLAEDILRLSRQLRNEFSHDLGNPIEKSYDSNFVWHLAPEISKRLGAMNLRPNEASYPRITSLSDVALRQVCGIYLQNVGIGHWPSKDDADTITAHILCNDVANGNPLAFAIDRLVPAPEKGMDRGDYIARNVREVSESRGFDATPYWSPRLQEWGDDHHPSSSGVSI